eukprot:scaffold26082_cov36-Cyclotella_meneghiniana.AAC.4
MFSSIPDVVPPGHVLSSKGDPLAAAAEVADEFMQTLQFMDQINALKKKVEEYMNVFQECEDKYGISSLFQ